MTHPRKVYNEFPSGTYFSICFHSQHFASPLPLCNHLNCCMLINCWFWTIGTAQRVSYRNLEPSGTQTIQNRFFMYWVDIEARLRDDAAVSSDVKLAFNTAEAAWIYAVEGFLQILCSGRFLDSGNGAAALLLARSITTEPKRGSIDGVNFEDILDQWIMATGLEIGYFSALCWPSSVIRRGRNSASEVDKSTVLRKQVSTLLAPNFHPYGSNEIPGKK
jgi:hypothetical protein